MYLTIDYAVRIANYGRGVAEKARSNSVLGSIVLRKIGASGPATAFFRSPLSRRGSDNSGLRNLPDGRAESVLNLRASFSTEICRASSGCFSKSGSAPSTALEHFWIFPDLVFQGPIPADNEDPVATSLELSTYARIHAGLMRLVMDRAVAENEDIG